MYYCVLERNLNPKAACLKRREEEKALRLNTSMSDAHGNSLMDSNIVSSLGNQLYYTGANSPPVTGGQSVTTPTQPGLPSNQPRPFSYTPSPPSLNSATEKIPRRSDPPMKRKTSSGNLSPTLRKNKGRLPIHTNALLTGTADLDALTNPVTSS